jgi:hypothetical protein
LEFAFLDRENELYPLASLLHVKNKDGQDILFIDQGVYTRNRNFRLWLSSKMGKTAILTLEPQSDFSFETFLKTLVCDGKESPLITFSNESSTTINEKRMKISHVRPIQSQSPYPSFEARLLYLISDHGSQPFIKSFIHYPDAILYVIGGNRYCNRIGREHTSNSVYYIIDISQESFHQRCFDPDCHGYRSPVRMLWQKESYFDEISDDVFLQLDVEDVGEERDYFEGLGDDELVALLEQ